MAEKLKKAKIRKIKISAPGKLLLMGDHGVVYGYSCLAMALNRRVEMELELLAGDKLILKAEDIGLDYFKKPLLTVGKKPFSKKTAFIEAGLAYFIKKYGFRSGLKITTKSEAVKDVGLGTSSAVVVCLVKALSLFLGLDFKKKELFDSAKKIVLEVQKKGSGFDVASAIWGGIIFFQKNGEIIESISLKHPPLVIGFSGHKADTVSMIALVGKKYKTHRNGVETIFQNINDLVLKAKEAIIEKDWKRLGVFMNFSQSYLENLGVSTDRLNQLITQARQNGAYGAKLSGAGGGDCMIALVSSERKKQIVKALELAGGEIINAGLSRQGVKVEKIEYW